MTSKQHLNIENTKIKEGLNSLSEFINELDKLTWSWQSDYPLIAKFRHIALHLSYVSGNLAKICERWEHAVINNPSSANDATKIDQELLNNIIADLIIHASQLGNMINADIFSILSKKISSNIQRFSPDSNKNL